MRQLLRRLAGIVLTLGIVLSMLGVAHASCDQAGAADAHGGSGASAHDAHMAQMAHMAHAPDDEATPPPAGCEDGMQGPAGHGTTACTLVAHCVTMMPAAPADVALAAAPADARRAPTDDTGPRAPALEPDSPPPRG